MEKGKFLFMIGLFFYLAGIYLSTIYVARGAVLGVFGGLMMGVSTYYLATMN
ncbi:hypothetical protein [Mesobacillus jeotgali]|uniref:hypothetical protein n=1 Tax=Mesobacillus jeotgali TaxID=129985 RepID=UPI001591D4CE|nr:hypothetical protein [Mesobacillus jeotgali]